jgi:ATP-dependent Clp protease ATP-binding subunit ClpA
MFERFSDRARKVMALANQEAHRFNHEYIGTEHILLGLIKEGSGIAAHVLKTCEVDIRTIRSEVERLLILGPDGPMMSRLPMTPRARRVIEFAIEEARLLNHPYVGTEHLLLGLLREHDGIGAKVLAFFGLELEPIRDRVRDALAGAPAESAAGQPLAPRRRSAEPTAALQRVFDRTLELSKSAEIRDLDVQIELLQNEKDMAVRGSNYEQAARLRNAQEELRQKVLELDTHPCTTAHVLLAILAHPSSLAAKALAEVGVEAARAREIIERLLREDPQEQE